MDHALMGRRRLLRGAIAVTAGSVAVAALPGRPGYAGNGSAGNGSADLVLHGGQVLVLDRHFTVARAVAIRNLNVGETAVRSIADIAAAVGAAVAQVAPGAWIRGKGWNETKFAEGRAPTRADLDGVARTTRWRCWTGRTTSCGSTAGRWRSPG